MRQLNPTAKPSTVPGVPGPPQQRLTPREIRELRRAEEKIEEARRSWAHTVRRLGISAVARELGITVSSLSARVRRYEQPGD
jgi:hypothetical protein